MCVLILLSGYSVRGLPGQKQDRKGKTEGGNMFFRRFVRHFRRQNWIAITLEFLVVVCGVVLGIQIDSWNTDHERDMEFDRAMGRLQIETQENIDAIRVIYTELESIIPDITSGLDALRQCRGKEEDINAVLKAVDRTKASRGVQLDRTALNEIMQSDHHLSRLSEADRARILKYARFVELFQRENDFVEDVPFEIRAWASPSISFGELRQSNIIYGGQTFMRQARYPVLAADFSDACKDEQLFNGLYIYELYQSVAPVWLRTAEQEMITLSEHFQD